MAKISIEPSTFENGEPCWTLAWDEDPRDGQYHEVSFTHHVDAELFAPVLQRELERCAPVPKPALTEDQRVAALMSDILSAARDYNIKHNRPPGGVLHMSLEDTQLAADNSPPRREGEFRPTAERMRVGQMFSFLGMTAVVDGDLADGEFRWMADEPTMTWPRWITQMFEQARTIDTSVYKPGVCGDRGESACVRPGTHTCGHPARPRHNVHQCNCGQRWHG